MLRWNPIHSIHLWFSRDTTYMQAPGIPERQNFSQMSQGKDRLRAVRVTVSDPKTRKKWGGTETVPP